MPSQDKTLDKTSEEETAEVVDPVTQPDLEVLEQSVETQEAEVTQPEENLEVVIDGVTTRQVK